MHLNSITHSNSLYKKEAIAHSTNQDLSKGNNIVFQGNPAIKVLSTLESNPVLSLATIDLFGMIMPRTLIDLNRNKGELGHYNWDAGRETFMREVFSSSILFFGPGLIFNWIGNKLLDSKFNPLGINTKTFTNYDTLKIIELKAQEILRNEALNGAKSITVEEFRRKLAESLLKGVKGATSDIALSEGLIKQMVDQVGNSSKNVNIDRVIQRFIKKEYKEEYKKAFEAAKSQLLKQATNPNATAINREAAKIAKEAISPLTKAAEGNLRRALIMKREHGIKAFLKQFLPKASEHIMETEAKLAANGAKTVNAGISSITRDIFFATDDIAMKAANGAEKVSIEQMRKGVDKVINSARTLKIAKVILPVAVIFTLLTTFPKFSNWLTRKLNGGKDQFPGLAGISGEKEEKVSFSSKKESHQSNPFVEGTQVKVSNNFTPIPKQIINPPDNSIFNDFERRMGR